MNDILKGHAPGPAPCPKCDRYRNQIACRHCGRRNPAYIRTTHGMSHSPTYVSWHAMKSRCTNPNHFAYSTYSQVQIDPAWMDFSRFLADMGKRPQGTTLDRIENDKGYCKDNCRWATPLEQARNRRDNRWFTIAGQTKTLAMWADDCGIDRSTVGGRLRRGWSIERALAICGKCGHSNGGRFMACPICKTPTEDAPDWLKQIAAAEDRL